MFFFDCDLPVFQKQKSFGGRRNKVRIMGCDQNGLRISDGSNSVKQCPFVIQIQSFGRFV